MHKWYYCEMCNAPTVICGNCGNNGCNGGEGCDMCKEAHKIEASREGCPAEFLFREKIEHEIFNINDADALKKMLCKEITIIQVNAILNQLEHLKE